MISTPIKILLVDDREDNLLSMELVLEKDGYSFERASSGKEALKILLKDQSFTLILLDVKMPVMDGYETAEIIYQWEKLRHIPIIFITGQDYEDAAVFKGYEAGAVDYIRKPVNPQILRSKVAIFSELFQKNHLLKQQDEKLRSINDDLTELNKDLEKRVRERTLELEELNQELKDLSLSKDKFLSVISHDLRNPLAALIVSAEKLHRDAHKFNPQEIAKLADLINRTSNRVLHQLNELVDWAKKQYEKTNFNPGLLNLHKQIENSLELLKDSAAQKNILLKNEVAENLHLNADSFMLRSIIQNLVSNSIKYTSEGGYISVSAIPLDNMIEVCVKDNGIGITEDLQEIIMARTMSTSTSGTNNEKGTGLGLILVKDFVAQHGGTFYSKSEKGNGAIFAFTMPGAAFD
ncbi:MAG: hybrid sensor histidine kinase/response regulator [Chitinophagaceae bacterium]|nr:hybrid sensor histidine kinase/response regulator [Chitinophagaceae bacterium]